jgi:hypothetical protein
MFIEMHDASHFFRKERNAKHSALCGDDKECAGKSAAAVAEAYRVAINISPLRR